MESASLIVCGRAFQSLGAGLEKSSETKLFWWRTENPRYQMIRSCMRNQIIIWLLSVWRAALISVNPLSVWNLRAVI